MIEYFDLLQQWNGLYNNQSNNPYPFLIIPILIYLTDYKVRSWVGPNCWVCSFLKLIIGFSLWPFWDLDISICTLIEKGNGHILTTSYSWTLILPPPLFYITLHFQFILQWWGVLVCKISFAINYLFVF